MKVSRGDGEGDEEKTIKIVLHCTSRKKDKQNRKLAIKLYILQVKRAKICRNNPLLFLLL